MIQKCSKCADYRSHAASFQNREYGYGMRVHNPSKGPNGMAMATCTVCGDKKARVTEA